MIRIRLVGINNMKVCLSDRLDCIPRTIISEGNNDHCITFEADAYEYMRRDDLHSQARNNKRMSRQCWRSKMKISSFNIICVDKLSEYYNT